MVVGGGLRLTRYRDRVLRYGVMVPGTTLPRWQVEVLDALDAVEGVEPVLVVVDGGPRVPRPTVGELWGRRRLAWTLFNRASARGSAALAPVDCSGRFAGLATMTVRPRVAGAWQEFPEAALRELREHGPDLLLRLGFGLLRGEVLEAAPLGVWSFHHDDERVIRGGPPCFWEMAHGDPVTGVLLQRLTDRLDGGVPLARAAFATVPHSYRRNRDQAYLGAACLPAQVASRVLADGPSAVEGDPSGSAAPLLKPPSWRRLARAGGRIAVAGVRRQLDGILRGDHWNVGVLDRPAGSLVERPGLNDVRWFPLPSSPHRYVADPSGCRDGDGLVVLVEELDHRESHGTLSSFRLDSPDATAGVRGPVPMARFDVHASYPTLVRDGDTWWCIPETARAGEVRAHRFDPATAGLGDSFPLLEGVAVVDPTVFRWDGRWWLFGTDRDRGSNEVLRAWWSEELQGPWTRHRVDPLLVDVTAARPAGAPFVRDGVLYRPAQRCAPRYGSAVALMRVDRLDPDGFTQTEVARVVPDPLGPCPHGVHTVWDCDGVTLVDGNRRSFSLPVVRRELRARLGR